MTDDLSKVANAYEARLVPAVFAQWPAHVIAAAGIEPGNRVLDVACGTGVLTRAVHQRVGTDGAVSAIDFNPAALAYARSHAPAVDFKEGDAESLPFEDEAFDRVVSQFGLMFFPDPSQAVAEMNRVLQPGGCIAIAVFSSLADQPAYAAIADVYEEVVSRDVAGALRAPFSMNREAFSNAFETAGLAPSINVHVGEARFASVEDMVLADIEGWFPFAQINLAPEVIQAVVTAAGRALKPFTLPDGQVRFELPVQIGVAQKVSP